MSDKLFALNLKISEVQDPNSFRSLMPKSETERHHLISENLANFGVESDRISEILSSTAEASLKMQDLEPNLDLVPFDEYGKEYYSKVSKMIIGSPDIEFYRPRDKKEVSDFFKNNSANPRQFFMDLVEDGKLGSLMQSVLVHALDPLGDEGKSEKKEKKTVYKTGNDDDEMREKTKEEVLIAKNSVGRLSEQIYEYGTGISKCIESIQSSKSYCEKLITSVIELNKKLFSKVKNPRLKNMSFNIVQGNIQEASQVSSSTKLNKIKSIATELDRQTLIIQSKKDQYLLAKSVEAKLKQKKFESLQILAQARYQKQQFKKKYGGLLKKITALIVFYKFLDNVRDLLNHGSVL